MSYYLDEHQFATTHETLVYLNASRAYAVDTYSAQNFAEEQDWKGFALVMDNSGPVVADPSDDYHWGGTFAQYALEKTNWNVIREALNEVTEQGEGYEWAEWENCIAYDYSNDALREVVERIEGALSDYPTLDESAWSAMEYEHAIEHLEREWNLPDDLDASDVLRVMHDNGHGDDYEGEWGWEDGVTEALAELGYQECAECEEIIKTGMTDALCYECADSAFIDVECDHALLLMDTHRNMSVFLTAKEIRESDKACSDCYALVFPYART